MTEQLHEKVKVVIDCSVEERDYIKMLAARKHMTISQYFLAMTKGRLGAKFKVPNKTTSTARQEALDGGGTAYDSMDDLLAEYGNKTTC